MAVAGSWDGEADGIGVVGPLVGDWVGIAEVGLAVART